MKKNEKTMPYEAPEAEEIEIVFEGNIAESNPDITEECVLDD